MWKESWEESGATLGRAEKAAFAEFDLFFFISLMSHICTKRVRDYQGKVMLGGGKAGLTKGHTKEGEQADIAASYLILSF